MREDNLLAVQPQAFVATTEAQLTLTGMNQRWGGGYHLYSPAG